MANEQRLIAENDVYALFDRNGTARLHIADIDLLPRVDAVEVVRCKDCKFFLPFVEPYSKAGQCKKIISGFLIESDFCSYGEKREDERREGE